jgi:hypothetical protein
MVTVDVGRFQSLGPFFNGLPAKRKSTLAKRKSTLAKRKSTLAKRKWY